MLFQYTMRKEEGGMTRANKKIPAMWLKAIIPKEEL
jgi:hypothetical protein